jgi:hypothetical protein
LRPGVRGRPLALLPDDLRPRVEAPELTTFRGLIWPSSGEPPTFYSEFTPLIMPANHFTSCPRVCIFLVAGPFIPPRCWRHSNSPHHGSLTLAINFRGSHMLICDFQPIHNSNKCPHASHFFTGVFRKVNVSNI